MKGVIITASVAWDGKGADLTKKKYSRAHQWAFDGGITVPASSSPHVVPPPWSDEKAIDPEEALVVAAASCHMLSFLYVVANAGFSVTSYTDEAEGLMAKNEQGRYAITKITLRPVIAFDGKQPSAVELDHFHHQAHEECFIANSLKSEIVVEAPK